MNSSRFIALLFVSSVLISAIIGSVYAGKDDDDIDSLVIGGGGIILKTGKKGGGGGKKGSTYVIYRKKRDINRFPIYLPVAN